MRTPLKKLVDKNNQKKLNIDLFSLFTLLFPLFDNLLQFMTKNNKHTDTQIHKTQDQVAPAAAAEAAGKQIKPKQSKITTQSNKSLPAQRCSTAVFKLAEADDNIEQNWEKIRK